MSDEQKKILIRKRGSIKSKLTVFENYVNGIKGSQHDDKISALSEQDLLTLDLKANKAEGLQHEFETVQEQLEHVLDEIELALQISERETFETSYYCAFTAAKTILTSCKRQNNVANEIEQEGAASISSSQRSNDNNSVGSVNLKSIKLPTISLPKFEGQYETWIEFRDTFASLIHENYDVNNIQKFHYLRACLQGSAANVIQSLELSSNNYQIAWDTLCNRYNNTNLLVHNHIKALFNLEMISKESSIKIRNLVDTVAKHLRSMKSLNEETESWDTLIIYLITSKMDSNTEQEWEKYKANKSLPTLTQMYDFLKVRADILETIELSHENKQKLGNKERSNQSRSLLTINDSCSFCDGKHPLYLCDEFQKLSCNDRNDKVRELRLCINCFKPNHFNRFCKSNGCKKCYRKHNTLLHVEPGRESVGEAQNMALSAYSKEGQVILLATVSILVLDSNKKSQVIRAVLDSGSQSNIISMPCYAKLNLKSTKSNLSIVGINGSASHSIDQCEVAIQSIHDSFSLRLNCAILPEIPGLYPNVRLDPNKFNIPSHLRLADPSFANPAKIEMLIGSEAFWNLIEEKKIKLGDNQPNLQKTKLGWVLAGPTSGLSKMGLCNFIGEQLTSNDTSNLQTQLAKFWELEEIPKGKVLSRDEIECESHFLRTHRRDKKGRFIVKIPLRSSESTLGESKDLALKRFYNLERKLAKAPEIKSRYVQFMSEYVQLGHMTEVACNMNNSILYYMPHHGVYREDHETTKLRVVFDGSAPSSTGVSANDLEMIGPVIQEDLFSIVIRFRQHPYVIIADIEKMYRQVLISPEQRNLQRILWRSDPSQPICAYTLNTVTYGRAAASFLAIRALHQLALECKDKFPQISNIIDTSFYVDDLICGCESVADASRICMQLAEILRSGCFNLKKWVSNDARCLANIPQSDWSSSVLSLCADQPQKTLGLTWSCASDTLSYLVNCAPINGVPTKRLVLSIISQVFDPLGIVSPCIIIAKIMLQKLWLQRLEWDEPLPEDISSYWSKFHKELPDLNKLCIKRHALCKNPVTTEIHGFSDACESAYGGCLYLRSTDEQGSVYTYLVCSKSKVAPLKPLTMPKLELSGALVLARLFNKVVNALDIKFDNCVLWCDSTIVLGWLRTSPNLLQTFVANRVSEIIELTKESTWRHVPTNQNPADILSRGHSPSALSNCSLWWHGPEWLAREPSVWPNLQLSLPKLPELRAHPQNCLTAMVTSDVFKIQDFSNLGKLQRVVAYCLRFIHNCREKNKNDKNSGFLRLRELQGALNCLTKIAQLEALGTNFQAIQKQYSRLLPFIDENGVIRVGGRLQNANIPFNIKHPPILHGKHPFTKLLFEHEHILLLHSGPQMLLSSMRQKFWPLSGRSLARKTVHRCITCFRANPKNVTPIMGNLPAHRVEPAPPFNTSGVDYAGPFLIKNKGGRGCKVSKCYVSLFVCFVTKAIHLELVTELTSSSFIMALKRFVSRRGMPSHIYSDNGTNFVGASSELKELGNFLRKNEKSITESLASIDINWHFIPARTAHFGGLWEAGVRSMKTHFKRVAGNSSLTYEEMYTLLVQIEGILNSRPISPMSSDPSDLSPLTPSHFLIGRPLTTIPDPDYIEVPEHRLNRYQRIQQLKQQFWSRWSREYLVELQGRTKWTKPQENIKVGELVLIKEDNQPSMKWNLGRVLELHPGGDKVVRVVSIKTKGGVVKRGVTKVCVLPISD